MMYSYGIGFSPSNRLSSNGDGASYLLDTYGSAVVGYSLRKIYSTYTGNIIRVRRSSDNVEQDIGLNGNLLDTTSLLSFIGANDGHVVSWYDQSGNARTITQGTATNQPKIISSGSLVVGTNGLPAIETDGGDFLIGSGWTNPGYGYTSAFVIDVPDLTTSYAIASASNNNYNQYFISRTLGLNRVYDNKGAGFITAAKLPIGGHLVAVTERYLNGTTSKGNAWEDGVQIGVEYEGNVLNGDGWVLFMRIGGNNAPNGTQIQEFIQFNSDLTSQITDVNTDINNYYNIY